MAPTTQDANSISIVDLFRQLWSGRVLIIVLPLLMAGVALTFVVISFLAQRPPAVYLVELRNIQNETYPNGTQFSPQDLLNPEVLAEVRARVAIPPEADLRQSVTVAYDSPTAAGLARTYQQRIALRNLTAPEIEQIDNAYRAELAASMLSSIRITVDYASLGVDAQTGSAIAAALPSSWSHVFTTRFRIFTDNEIANLAVSQQNEDLSTTGSILNVTLRINAMNRGLAILIADNRLGMLRNIDGTGAVDLQLALRRFETAYFSPIRASRFRAGDPIADSYLRDLSLDLEDLGRQVEAFDVTLSDVRSYRQSSPAPVGPGSLQSPSGDRANVQVGDSALSEIVQLAEQASMSSFLQETLENRQNLMVQMSDVQRQLDLVATGSQIVTTTTLLTESAEQLASLTDQYVDLIAQAEMVLRDRSGQLYQPLLGPYIGSSLVSLQNLLSVAIATFAGLLIAVTFVLARAGLRGGRAGVAGQV